MKICRQAGRAYSTCFDYKYRARTLARNGRLSSVKQILGTDDEFPLSNEKMKRRRADRHGYAQTVPTFRKAVCSRALALIIERPLPSHDYLRPTSLHFPFPDNFPFCSAVLSGTERHHSACLSVLWPCRWFAWSYQGWSTYPWQWYRTGDSNLVTSAIQFSWCWMCTTTTVCCYVSKVVQTSIFMIMITTFQRTSDIWSRVIGRSRYMNRHLLCRY